MAIKQHRIDSSYKNKSKDAHVECAAILYGLRMSMTDTSQNKRTDKLLLMITRHKSEIRKEQAKCCTELSLFPSEV